MTSFIEGIQVNFRKLISNLPFNPSLVGQVSFYYRRARQESSLRRIGFAFTALAMVVQMFAVIAPPQVSLASSDRNIIQGSFSPDQAGVLAKYDASPWVQAVYANFGITRDDITKMTVTAIDKATDAAIGKRHLITGGRGANGSAGEYSVDIASSEYTAPFFVHSITSTYVGVNFIPVLYCPPETCGRTKMIILGCGNPVIDTNEAPAPEPQGYVDGSNCSMIYGWAYNNQYDRFVHFYVDRPAFGGAVKDKDYYEVAATQSRPDVKAALGLPAEVGYSWNGGPLNGDGRAHQLWVYVSDRVEHYKLLTGGEGVTVNFNCPKPTPTPTPPTPMPTPKCTIPGKTDLNADDVNCKEPIATCDLLQSSSDKYQVKTAVHFTARATANYGATINSYNLDFGDNNGKLTNYKLTDDIQHTYAKAGTYTVKLYAETSLGQKTASSCQKDLTITPEPVPCPSDSSLTLDNAKCKPCAENPKVQSSDASCVPTIVKEKRVSNTTQNISNFDGKTAAPGDTLVYTLTTTNVSNKLTQKDFVVSESIIDILDYADVVDLHGGKLDDKTKVVSWDKTDIAAGKALQNQITVKVKSVIPATPTSTSDPGTFDLKMVNTYGNTVTVNVPCGGPKCVEKVVFTLPNTGPGTSAVFGFAITMVVGYFFARSRIIARELELIKQDYAPTGGF